MAAFSGKELIGKQLNIVLEKGDSMLVIVCVSDSDAAGDFTGSTVRRQLPPSELKCYNCNTASHNIRLDIRTYGPYQFKEGIVDEKGLVSTDRSELQAMMNKIFPYTLMQLTIFEELVRDKVYDIRTGIIVTKTYDEFKDTNWYINLSYISCGSGECKTAISGYFNKLEQLRGIGGRGRCYVCGSEGKMQKCSKCEGVCYCSVECQKKDRIRHREACNEYALINKSRKGVIVRNVSLDHDMKLPISLDVD